MIKKTLLMPTLSSLLLSTAVLGQAVAADEADLNFDGFAVDSLNIDTTVASAASGNVSFDDILGTYAETNNEVLEISSDAEDATQPVDLATVLSSPQTNQSTESSEEDAKTDELASQEASSEEAKSEEITSSEASKSAFIRDADVAILHTNDIHGRIVEESGVIGVAKLASVVNEVRENTPTTLVLDAGDAFQGLPISNSSQGEDLVNILNEIGYDAMAVGNHEFDFGLEQVRKYIQMLNFPLLSANVYVDNARLFQAYTVVDKDFEVAGDEYVVIGVTTPETATKTHPKNVEGVTFTEPIDEVNNVIAEVEARAKAEGVTYNNYIVLAHLGIDNTTPTEWQGSTLAEALSKNEQLVGKNVIVIDGHSHTLFSATYGNVVYNQTGSYLNNIGYITLNSGTVLNNVISDAEVVDEGIEADAKIAQLVDELKARYDAENATVIVENNPVNLSGDRKDVRVRETNLGNVVADALYAYGQTGFSNPSDIAVTNGGGLRQTLPADQAITKGDVIAVLPFGNTISQIEVTGEQIQAMFEKSLGSIHQVDENGETILDENGNPLLEPSGGFLQISGAKVYYDTNLEAGSRVLSIQVLDRETGNYVDLDLAGTYYLVTNDFLAAGGDGYDMLGGSREEGPSMDVAFADFLATADLNEYAVVNPNSRTISVNSTLDSNENGTPDYLEQNQVSNDKPVEAPEGTSTDETTKETVNDTKDVAEKATTSENKHHKGRHGHKHHRGSKFHAPKEECESTSVSTEETTSTNELPNTGAQESMMSLFYGVSLLSYAAYGLRRKAK